jgi:hypothetical protein
MKYLSLILVLFFILLPGAFAAKPQNLPATPRPGETTSSSGGIRIFLEEGRSLTWSSGGVLQLQEANGVASAQVDLKTRAKKTGGAEAMGLEVEEADLGGGSGGKGYLRGKKDPKGRALDPSAVGSTPDETAQGQSQSQVVAGVKITQTKFPNGSYQLDFDWGKASETVFFDKRSTMVWDEIAGSAGPLRYRLRQWADGSFSRVYRDKSGEVNYSYDAISRSYRLIFANAGGEIVAEASCDGTCSLD